MIHTISFDLDDTLYDFTTASTYAIERAREKLIASVGPVAESLTLDEVIDDLIGTADEMVNPYAQLHAFRIRAFLKTLARFGNTDAVLAEELSHTYLEHRYDRVTLFDDARETLERLGERYKLCAVSNGEQNLEQLGLDDLLEVVVFAEQVGVDKPDARIFEAAMERTGCAPETFAHVGDSVHSDVAAVQALGGIGIWFNGKGRADPTDVRPDATVTRLSELPGVIAKLDGGVS